MTAPSGRSLTCWVEMVCSQLLAVVAGQREHGAVGTVHHDGAVGGGPLFAERVAVVPDGAGVGPVSGAGTADILNSTALPTL